MECAGSDVRRDLVQGRLMVPLGENESDGFGNSRVVSHRVLP